MATGMQAGDEEVGSHADSEVASSKAEDISAVLRILAETQQQLLKSQLNGNGKARILASVKIPPFEGAQGTTVRQYREWRKELAIVQELNGLTDREVAMLLFSQLKGRSKHLIEVLGKDDFEREDVLELVWGIYDDAFEKMAHQRLDDLNSEWESAHRRPGQPMQDWCVYLRKLRMELQIQDPDSNISDRSLASKMLRGSGLVRVARAQVLWNCGGLYDSNRMETVLKVTYSDIQKTERRTGQVVPKRNELRRSEFRGRDRSSREQQQQFGTSPRAPGTPSWKTNGSKYVHEVEVKGDESDDESDGPPPLADMSESEGEGMDEGAGGLSRRCRRRRF